MHGPKASKHAALLGVHIPVGWVPGHAVHVVQVQTGLAPIPHVQMTSPPYVHVPSPVMHALWLLGAVVGQLALLPPLLLPEDPEDPEDEPEEPEEPDDPEEPDELEAPEELPDEPEEPDDPDDPEEPEEPEEPDDPEEPEEPDDPEEPEEPDDSELASVPPPLELVLPPHPGAIKTNVPTDAAKTRKSRSDFMESTSRRTPTRTR